MARHLVVAQQPGYEGKTLGVVFHNGQAVVDEHSVDPKLGRTPAQVIETFKKDFPGYTVEPLGSGPSADAQGAVSVPEMPWKGKDEGRGARMKAEAKAKAEKPKAKPRAKKAAG